jgi:hypothetical protein
MENFMLQRSQTAPFSSSRLHARLQTVKTARLRTQFSSKGWNFPVEIFQGLEIDAAAGGPGVL